MKTAQTSTDLVRTYLREIGRVPLLTHEQEILYGKQVQRLSVLYVLKEDLIRRSGIEPTLAIWAEQAQLSAAELQQRSRKENMPSAAWWRQTCGSWFPLPKSTPSATWICWI